MAFIDYGCYVWKNNELLLPTAEFDKAKQYLDSLEEKGYAKQKYDNFSRFIDGHGAVFGTNFVYSVLKNDCSFLTMIDHDGKVIKAGYFGYVTNQDTHIVWKKYWSKKECTINYENEYVSVTMTTETPGIKNYDGRLCKHIIIDKQTNDEYIIVAGSEYGTNADSLEDIDGAYTYPDGEPVQCDILRDRVDYNNFLEVFKTLKNKYDREYFLWKSWDWPDPCFSAYKYVEIENYQFGRLRNRKKALRLQKHIRPFMKYGCVPIKFKYIYRLR